MIKQSNLLTTFHNVRAKMWPVVFTRFVCDLFFNPRLAIIEGILEITQETY